MELNVENLQLLATYVGDVKKKAEHTLAQQPTPNPVLGQLAARLATAENRLKDLQGKIVAQRQADAAAIHTALQSIKDAADNPDFIQVSEHTGIDLDFTDYAPLTFQAPQQGTIGLRTAMQAAVRAETQVIK